MGHRHEEWVGGSVRLPRIASDDGLGAFSPEAFVWLDPDGCVLGTTLFHPDEMPRGVIDHFRATTRKPAVGAPHVPERVRVASDELAATLRGALGPDVEVVCAPTPELDGVAASVRERLEAAPTLLAGGLTPAAVAAMFAAAARLFRAQPWNVTGDDRSVFSIAVPELGLDDGVLAVMGQKGERLGLLVFEDVESFARYLAGALEALERGSDSRARVGPHLVLDFSRGKDVAASLRKEIAVHGWEIASANAYPAFVAVDEDLLGRPPSPRDAAVLEAAANALAELVARTSDVAALADGVLRRTFEVATARGPARVALTYPHPDLELDDADLDQVANDVDTLALFEDFLESPEGRALPDLDEDEEDPTWPLVLLNFAEDHHGATVSELTASVVEDVVFRVLPRQPACREADAAVIVRDLRAFFAFLERTNACAEAAECHALFAAGAEERLLRAFVHAG